MSLSWLKKYNLVIFEKIDSTNSEAIRLAKAGVSGDYIIWSESQTAGRGRAGRSWSSESGNLYFSLLLDRGITLEKQPQLSFVVAVALYDTIDFLAKKDKIPLPLGLKWPNDLLVNNKKLAGMLLESLTLYGKNYLIIGLGVNVKLTPKDIDKPVTSLVEEGVYILDNSTLLDTFMNYFQKYFAIWRNKGFMRIRESWLAKAYNLNEMVVIDDGKNKISGEFKDIDANGNIRIKLADGRVQSLSTGEVFFGKKLDG